jgi:hypothetical protein
MPDIPRCEPPDHARPFSGLEPAGPLDVVASVNSFTTVHSDAERVEVHCRGVAPCRLPPICASWSGGRPLAIAALIAVHQLREECTFLDADDRLDPARRRSCNVQPRTDVVRVAL